MLVCASALACFSFCVCCGGWGVGWFVFTVGFLGWFRLVAVVACLGVVLV